ncbi:MAG TPA: isochorismatase family protein [bacterium]|nr:isochorismatase family protein [bacterium]
MKEPYFTPKNIAERAAALLRAADGYRREPPRKLSADETALLILDMQRCFLEEGSHAFVPGAPAIIPQINALAAAFKNVVLTRHTNTRENAGAMGRWWRDLIEDGDPMGELDPRLDARGLVIVKTQYDAFYGTDLEKILRERGVCNVVVSGVMTHLCCGTTARSAFVRGFDVYLPVDATATYTEALHRASLLTLSHGFAVPLLTCDLLRLPGVDS